MARKDKISEPVEVDGLFVDEVLGVPEAPDTPAPDEADTETQEIQASGEFEARGRKVEGDTVYDVYKNGVLVLVGATLENVEALLA